MGSSNKLEKTRLNRGGEKMIKRIWNCEITIGQLLVGGILGNTIAYLIRLVMGK